MQNLIPGFDSSSAFVLLILGFGFVIFVHELGHFLVAKAVGIKVTQFAIGFGPAMASWRKGIGLRWGTTEPEMKKRLEAGARPSTMGETEYRLNWLPLGGYVKMLGQDDMDPTAVSDDARSFNRKPIWARACVITAGVVMNLIFGVMFFVIAFLKGVAFPPPVVGDVVAGMPAQKAVALGHSSLEYQGLKPGDKILEIDGESITDFMDIALATALASRDHTLRLAVQRAGESSPLIYHIKPQEDPVTGLLSVGISQPFSTKLSSLPRTKLPDELTRAGVEKGMKVVAVDSGQIDRFDQIESAVVSAQGKPVKLTFSDGASKRADVEVRAISMLMQEGEIPANLLGLVPGTAVLMVDPGSPAEEAGLQPGDVLASVDDVAWPKVEQVSTTIQAAKGRKVSLSVHRGGKLVDLKAVLPNRQGRLGFRPFPALDMTVVSSVLPDSPMASLNLTAGSRILQINGTAVWTYADLDRALKEAANAVQARTSQPAEAPLIPTKKVDDHLTQPTVEQAKPAGFTIQVKYELNVANQPGFTNPVQLTAEMVQQSAKIEWVLPPTLGGFEILRVPVVAKNPFDAARLGIVKTHQFMMQTYMTLLRLFQRTVPVSGLHGPIGIAHAGTAIARDSGVPYLLFFLGIISVNLVVINFLPMPIVDGGLMVFLIVEKIKGSPVSPKVLSAVNYIGLAMIATIFLVVSYFDILRLM